MLSRKSKKFARSGLLLVVLFYSQAAEAIKKVGLFQILIAAVPSIETSWTLETKSKAGGVTLQVGNAFLLGDRKTLVTSSSLIPHDELRQGQSLQFMLRDGSGEVVFSTLNGPPDFSHIQGESASRLFNGSSIEWPLRSVFDTDPLDAGWLNLFERVSRDYVGFILSRELVGFEPYQMANSRSYLSDYRIRAPEKDDCFVRGYKAPWGQLHWTFDDLMKTTPQLVFERTQLLTRSDYLSFLSSDALSDNVFHLIQPLGESTSSLPPPGSVVVDSEGRMVTLVSDAPLINGKSIHPCATAIFRVADDAGVRLQITH